MRNTEQWRPSKYVIKNGLLKASRDRNEVGVGSRLITDIVASYYWIYIKKYCRGKLLDLGCGKVPLFEAYSKYIDSCICVDWTNSIHGSKHLDLVADLSKPLPISSEQFDTIILSDVLEHIPEPMVLWQELHRVLKDDGKVLINVPFCYWIHEHPYDYYRFTEFALRYHSQTAGFKILVLSPIGGAPEVLGDMLSKLVAKTPGIGNYLSLLIQLASSGILKTTIGVKLSNKTERFFPLGYFMVVHKAKSETSKDEVSEDCVGSKVYWSEK